MSWTDERIELLSRLWMEGKSASQISQALGAGLSRNAVIGKVHRLGLAGRAKTASSSQSMPGASRARAPQPKRGGTARGGLDGGVEETRAGVTMVAAAAHAAHGAAHAIHGNNALALQPQAAMQVAPVRLEQEVVVPLSLRVTIVELKETMCKWPLGHPTSNEFRYCGSPAPGGAPYCAHHGKLAYQPAQDRRRDRDRDRVQRSMIAR